MALKNDWMKLAVNLAVENVRHSQGGPFGAVIVRQGELVSSGVNKVTTTNDPTAHAEVTAIRTACQKLGQFQLQDCELYTSCEPCPMCLGAIYWARLKSFYFACNRFNAAKAGFDDAFIYDQIAVSPDARTIAGTELLTEIGNQPFDEWIRSLKKISY